MTDHAGETARQIAHTACAHSGVLQTPCCACLDDRIAAALTQQHAALVERIRQWEIVFESHRAGAAALVGERVTGRAIYEAMASMVSPSPTKGWEHVAQHTRDYYDEVAKRALTPPPAERAQESEKFCECGHDWAQHSKGPVREDYCRHCPCPAWSPCA